MNLSKVIGNTPLLILPFILYHLLTVSMESLEGAKLFEMTLLSGQTWHFGWDHLVLLLGIGLLCVEIAKATRTGAASIFDHMLSLALFVISLIEFLLWKPTGTSTFFLLMMMMFVDVVGGFTITIRGARRDFGGGGMVMPQ